MRVMILAAGRGERMRPLTDSVPKALLPVGGKPLIVWHLERLSQAGFRHVVINLAHLGGQICQALGDGSAWNLHIVYSPEPVGALETAGGIAHALPLLGERPFLVINADIFCDWPLAPARTLPMQDKLAHLVLVDNPPHHPDGDFCLEKAGKVTAKLADKLIETGGEPLTYAGIGIYAPAMFEKVNPDQPSSLAPLLHEAIVGNKISGERHGGIWRDVGTPERLYELDGLLTDAAASNVTGNKMDKEMNKKASPALPSDFAP